MPAITITPDDVEECLAIVSTLCMTMSGMLVAAVGVPAATLKYGIDDLSKNAEHLILSYEIIAAICVVFQDAFAAGATITSVELVRSAMTALTPVSPSAQLISVAAIQCCLATECQIYAAFTFTSRQQVDAALVQVNNAFGPSEEYAVDARDTVSFKALIKAHADIVNHLNSTARPLAKMTTYSFPVGTTSYTLAQRLYADPSRADELVAENLVVHPMMMPASGIALSA